MKTKLVALCVGLSAVLVGSTALAQDGAFGRQGQISIQGDFQLSITSTSTSAPAGQPSPNSVTNVVLAPALDYFVIDGLSIGGQLGYTSTSQGNGKYSAFEIGPRIGYNIRISDVVSFWPRGGINFETGSESGPGFDSQSLSKLTLVAFAPFLIHPASHFFLGIGPSFSTDLSSSYGGNAYDKDTTFGVMSMVGGWF